MPDTIPVAKLAHAVLKNLPHVMLTGEGARRYATEIGFSTDDVLFEDSKRVWWERLQKEMSPEQAAAFPNTPLAPLLKTITDPERVRDTTVWLSSDRATDISFSVACASPLSMSAPRIASLSSGSVALS